MIFTFKELGINISEYNGTSAQQASADIINKAANLITLSQYGHPATSVEMLYDWENSTVDFVAREVKIIPLDFNRWAALQ